MQQPWPHSQPPPQPPPQQAERPRRGGRRNKQYARATSSLAALLIALQGTKLTFELRNDTTVSGTLSSVDAHMNAYVDDAVWQPLQGPARIFPFLYVKGRQLRYVHLPPTFDPARALYLHRQQLVEARVRAACDLLAKRHKRLSKGVQDEGGDAGGGHGGAGQPGAARSDDDDDSDAE